jgi:hypothetical protein
LRRCDFSSNMHTGPTGVARVTALVDGAGAGGVSLHSSIASGATGAWMYITRTGEFSQIPAEFYTSDFVVPI